MNTEYRNPYTAQSEFIALSLYTGPENVRNVISEPDCPWILGTWNGINTDTESQIKQDIDARINFILTSFNEAFPYYTSTNRYFVIPEFFFHCKQGPYPNISINGQSILEYIINSIKHRLENFDLQDNYYIIIGSILTSNVVNYDHFLKSDPVNYRMEQLNKIVSGKINTESFHSYPKNRILMLSKNSENTTLDKLNNFMNICRGNPLCTVRNRIICFHCDKSSKNITTYVCEKQSEATVDLTMGVCINNKIDHDYMITEWMANYPSYSIFFGDKQTDQSSTNARFVPNSSSNYDFGIEICLDHRFQRLRRTVEMNMKNGAAADNYPLEIQIIPSGGMQILDYAVASSEESPIFNADGADKIYGGTYGDDKTVILDGNSGTYTGITAGVYTISAQSKWNGQDGSVYYSHSQLAFTTDKSTLSGYDNALLLNNVKASTYDESKTNSLTDSYKVNVYSLKNSPTKGLFAIDKGELHVYSQNI